MVTYPLERGHQKSVLAITIAFSALAVLSVLLRIVARVKLRRPLDLSDYVVILSTVSMIALAASIINSIFHAGLGFHVSEIEDRFGVVPGDAEMEKHIMASRISATFTLGLSKISILFLGIRVFATQRFRLLASLTIGLIVAWMIGDLILILKLCTPIEYNWNKSIKGGYCIPSKYVWIVMGIINICADVVVLILPLPYIYRLQLAMYKKVTLLITFGIGFIVCIVAVIRVAFFPATATADITYTIHHALILAMLEAALSVTIACIPVLRPLFKNSLAAATKSRYPASLRHYSTVPPTGKNTAGARGTFTELHNLFMPSQHHMEAASDEEGPLPMRPEKTYYNRIEAVGRSSEDEGGREDVEMGGIVVKTEFHASIEVVEVDEDEARRARKSVRRSESRSLSHL